MKIYELFLRFQDRDVRVRKSFKNDEAACFWATLCLDICGKDENGNRYTSAVLFENAFAIKAWRDGMEVSVSQEESEE